MTDPLCSKCNNPLRAVIPGVLVECIINAHSFRVIPVPAIKVVTGKALRPDECRDCEQPRLPRRKLCMKHLIYTRSYHLKRRLERAKRKEKVSRAYIRYGLSPRRGSPEGERVATR